VGLIVGAKIGANGAQYERRDHTDRRAQFSLVIRVSSSGDRPSKVVILKALRYYVSAVRTLTVKIPEPLERNIALVARRERISKSELVRRATTHYVAQRDEKRSFQTALDLAGGLIGSVRGAPADLAANPDYLDDYGK
jgi:Arc/MetJ-type ribon-helix-helix transcriptional regulator